MTPFRRGALAVWLAGCIAAQSFPAVAQPFPQSAPLSSSTQPGALQAGGLRAPSAPNRKTEIIQQLQRAETENTGRGLQFIWLDASAGIRGLWLTSLSDNNLLSGNYIPDSAGALNLEAAAGARLLFLTVGTRLRRASTMAWDFWSLGGEVGLHIPLGYFEPSASISAGYSWLSGAQAIDSTAASDGTAPVALDIGGLDMGMAAQLAWYPHPAISLALRADMSVLVLRRDAINSFNSDSPYSKSGSALGISSALQLGVGLHF